MTTLPHPVKSLVTLEQARQWSPGEMHITRKYDGELCGVKIAGAVIIAEHMRGIISGHFYDANDRAMFITYGSWYAALTVGEVHGENVLHLSNFNRWAILRSLLEEMPDNMILAEQVTDIDATMAAGAEGVCAVPWSAPWGSMLAYKANSIYVCRVISTSGSQSVGIEDAETGQPRGNVKLGGGKCDQVRKGSILRIEGMGLTDKGLIRQPVACREWLVKF